VSVVHARIITAAAALTAAVAISTAVRRYRTLHQTLDRERATHRLMDGCLDRDLAAFHHRINAALAGQHATAALLAEAGQIIDQAHAAHTHPHDPSTEGGPT